MKVTVKTSGDTYIFDNAEEVDFELPSLYARSIPSDEGVQGYRVSESDNE